MSDDKDFSGWKTLETGERVPLMPDEARQLWEAVKASQAKLAADMPTVEDALREMGRAYERLKQLGFREAMHCPKDGSLFEVIEAGSTGIHDCHYDGKWPDGTWWIHSHHDLWPSRPILFRLKPEAQAVYDAKMQQLRETFAARSALKDTEA